jgi:hypothetical protein
MGFQKCQRPADRRSGFPQAPAGTGEATLVNRRHEHLHCVNAIHDQADLRDSECRTAIIHPQSGTSKYGSGGRDDKLVSPAGELEAQPHQRFGSTMDARQPAIRRGRSHLTPTQSSQAVCS